MSAIAGLLIRGDLAAARLRMALARLLELTDSEALALAHLARAGPLTSSELGARLQLSSGGATALVQRLERNGCVVREPNPGDRRSTLLRLTPEVARRAADALAPLERRIDTLVAQLPEHDREIVEAFLRAVAEASERHAEELARRDAGELDPGPVPGLWS